MTKMNLFETSMKYSKILQIKNRFSGVFQKLSSVKSDEIPFVIREYSMIIEEELFPIVPLKFKGEGDLVLERFRNAPTTYKKRPTASIGKESWAYASLKKLKADDDKRAHIRARANDVIEFINHVMVDYRSTRGMI